jgi:16S rRNA (guanine966-N2)-methyltransferase
MTRLCGWPAPIWSGSGRRPASGCSRATPPGSGGGGTRSGLFSPPRSGLAGAALEGLLRGGWLRAQARVILELAATEDLELPHDYTLEDERRYGKAKFVFLRPSA